MSFCDNFVRAKGEIKRLFKFTGGNSWTEDATGSGRLFSDGSGIQGLPKIIRGFLMEGTTTDIDMENAHPRLLLYLCRKHEIEHTNLRLYVENRSEILAQFPDRAAAKALFLSATNYDKLNKKEENEFFKNYDKEMKEIQKMLTKLTCYKRIVADVPENRLYNWNGSAMNRIMCYYENRVLQVIISALNSKEIEICTPMFDGCLVYGVHYEDKELLAFLEDKIEEEFPGMGMKLTYKEHDGSVQMPDDFEVLPKKRKLISFQETAEEFEKTHCKIVNKSCYVKYKRDSDLLFFKKKDLVNAYEHLTYQYVDKKKDEVIEKNFIHDWTKNNPKIKKYEDCDIYPNIEECPEDYLNLWIPFAMGKVDTHVEKEEELDFILNHIKILCGHEQDVYEYFLKWIADMIQKPERKPGTVPVFISGQGAGKSMFMNLLRRMFGERKVLETSEADKYVFGHFNSLMKDAFLVVLNEVEFKQLSSKEGNYKELATEPHFYLHQKNVDPIKLKSYHRMIAATNKEEPMKTCQDDRRNFFIRCSDEKIGDKEYFRTLSSYIDDVDVVKTCYEYFRNYKPDVDLLTDMVLPVTQYHKNVKDAYEHAVRAWLRWYVQLLNDEEDEVNLSSDLFRSFNVWCEQNQMNYKMTGQSFGCKLANIRIEGVSKGAHTKCGEQWIFDREKISRHFGLVPGGVCLFPKLS
jgi:hypothetical protein